MALTKAELIGRLLDTTAANKSTISCVLDALALEVTAQMKTGETVILPGIGKLTPVAKPARAGRNPSTGAEVQIAAKTVVKFTAAKALKDAIA